MISLTAKYVTEEKTRQILEPYLPILTSCLKVPWQQWERLKEEKTYDLWFPLTPRTRACFLYDHICHQIRHQFEGICGVTITEEHGFLLLNVQNLLLIRFKKLNSFGQASNVHTQQQKDYNLQLELPGIPNSAARITAGYLLDKLQNDVEDIRVVLPIGARARQVIWSYSILGNRIEAIQPEMEFEEPVKPKVKAKRVTQVARKTSEQ